MLTDLVQISRMGEQKRDENSRFRAYLKRHNFPEPRFRRIAEQIEDETECRACGNCCRVASASVTERDIDRLAKYLGMRRNEFVAQHTELSKDEGVVLKRTESGCVFLVNNECSVYEERPQTCRHFPHLVRGSGSFLSRMWHMPDRATYCPIVYNSLEDFKRETGFTGK